MLTTLSVLAVLTAAPGEESSLKLSHVRTTHGILGPSRSGADFLPGDSLVLAFDIEGLTVDDGGKVLYSTALEVADDKGKVLFKRQPQDLETINALGGGSLPAFARLDVGVHQPAGDYVLTLTVTDRAAKKSKILSQKARVLPAGFGIVRLHTSTDAEGHAPAAALAAGESLWVSAGVVGFARDTASKQPRIRLSLRVLGEDGKPTLAKPFVGEVNKDIPVQALSVPAQFHLSLNRAGKFTVELEAEDTVAGKKSMLSFPINVQAVK